MTPIKFYSLSWKYFSMLVIWPVKCNNRYTWLRWYKPLLQPFTSIANLTASSFNKYESGTRTIQTKKSKRANSRSSHSPPWWIWNRKYLRTAIVPPRNSSIQDITVIWMPILFLRRLLIFDSSDKLAKIVSLDSHLLVNQVIMLVLIELQV